ncbi:mucoidy inhibitor MuiA family protein [Phreatobacter sp.]|uniref:mucoidy inhibitor MuiA family protein n=1 Tax=Phreatobacter sp. TaxID=1966341 RepID=UPI0022CA49C1|nr:mucoidy inhibitor MuiA family protein [Phreatobacter sp.]MCZ8315355.1 mucoidy inhibitor MuiA family protein [Phreatobacter sp.]
MTRPIAASAAPLAVLVLASAAALPVLAADIPVNARPDAVTVFPDGASVTRRLTVTVPAGEHVLVIDDLPLTADPGSIRVQGAGSGSLAINAVDARQPRPTERRDPVLVQRLETLKDERQALDDRIAAERVRKRAAEALVAPGTLAGGERGLVIAEARQALAAAHEETIAADRAIRQAEQAQRGLDRTIAEIEAQLRAQPPRRLEARIAVEAGQPFRGELTLTYAVRQARWSPVYDARLVTTSAKPQLELVRRAEIRQQTGEDWSDVALTVSTARVARGGAAPVLQPLVLRFHDPEAARDRAAASGAPRPLAMPAPASPAREQADASIIGRAAETEAVAEVGAFQASFVVPGRAQIASGEGARTLRIASSTLEPDLVSRVVPSLDITAFLEARFRHGDDVPLMAGPVSLYRDGIFAGRGQIAAATREDEVKLGFGPDDLLRVDHQVVRRTDGSSGIISTSRTEEREFRFVLRNGAQVARRVVVEDRMPVPEQQEITVETLAGMTAPTQREPDGRRGIVAWSLDITPGASRDIRHGWRIRWPADKRMQ